MPGPTVAAITSGTISRRRKEEEQDASVIILKEPVKRLFCVLAVLFVTISALGQNRIVFRFGVDTSVDDFLTVDNKLSSTPSYGIGVRGRLGSPEQWLNFVGGLRYIYGPRLSGFQVPLMLNVNLLRGETLSGYVGGGWEFDFAGTYLGCTKFQAGIALKHLDFRLFYKPYQGDIGAGVSYYF